MASAEATLILKYFGKFAEPAMQRSMSALNTGVRSAMSTLETSTSSSVPRATSLPPTRPMMEAASSARPSSMSMRASS